MKYNPDEKTEQGKTDLDHMYKALQQKYIASVTKRFVSVRENGQPHIFNPQIFDELRSYVLPELEVRPKYSGSSAIESDLKVQKAQELLSVHGIELESFEKSSTKTRYRPKNFDLMSKEEVKKLNEALDTRSRRDNIQGIRSNNVNPFIGATGEITDRSETMNMTVIIRPRLRDNAVPASFEDYTESIKLLTEEMNDLA